MKATVSTTYVLKWELADYPWYKFDEKGICVNTRTNKTIKQVMNGRSIGYCIQGKFKALSTLRTLLRKVERVQCPF